MAKALFEVEFSPEPYKKNSGESFDVESTPKSQDFAKEFSFFGYTPSPEKIEKLRHKFGVGMKEFTGGLASLGDFARFLGETGTAGVFSNIFKKAPGSKQAEDFFEKMAGEKFERQDAVDALIGDITGGLGSIIGLSGPLKATSKIGALGRTMLGAFVPGTVSWASDQTNLPDWLKTTLTIGSAILTNRITGKSLRQVENELFDKAKDMGKNVMIDVSPEMSKLESFEKEIQKRIKTSPTAQFLLRQIDAVKEKFQRGLIPGDEYIAIRSSLNDVAQEARQLKGGKKLLGVIKQIAAEPLDRIEKQSPEFAKIYESARSLSKGLNQSVGIEEFLKDNAKLAGKSFNILPLLKTATASAAFVLGGKGLEVAIALARNKGLRKAYWDVIKNASKNEIKATAKSLDVFNKHLEKSGIKEELYEVETSPED